MADMGDYMNNLTATEIYHTTFQHIYFTTGFYIDAAYTENKEAYIPAKSHACLRCGYWCWQNAKERPQDILHYATRPIRLLTYRLKTKINQAFTHNEEDL